MDTEPKTHNEYTVGWVCALPKEQTAATAMLDRRHAGLPKPQNDPNTYTLGSVGSHNVVIACLPKGQIGNNSAASVATWMISTFPSIKFGLMVGIGGGVPPKVRLGDVVVSTPVGQFPGVVQWDFGKAKEGGSFERTGSLNNPPTSLLTALTALETEHDLVGSKIPEYLEELREKWPRLVSKYLPSDLQDMLFKADYEHSRKHVLKDLDDTSDVDDIDEEEEEESCRLCDKTKVVKRRPRDMSVHFGLIASGNQVVKDATLRTKLNKDLGGHLLCIEMEAAGLMNNFPCIVIRGICDYADSHKNKDWQEYAAAVAAAFAKEFLAFLQPTDVEGERPVKEILGQVFDVVSQSGENVKRIKGHLEQKKELKILNWITPINYGPEQSDFLGRRQRGTGQWLLESIQFQTWKATKNQTMFCPGMPGAGKTIISSIVIDHLDQEFQADPTIGIAYVYCNFKRQDSQNGKDLLASLLKQLAAQCQPFPDSVKELYEYHEARRTRPSTEKASKVLLGIVATFSKVFIIVDALDECQASEREHFLSEVFNLQTQQSVNIFATSRFISNIMDQFQDALSLEIRATDEDVGMYLEKHMGNLRPIVRENRQLQEEIRTSILHAVDGMFLLAQLYIGFLNDKLTTNDIRESLKSFQRQNQGSSENEKTEILSNAYDQVMERIHQQRPGLKQLAVKVLFWLTCAKRPLSIAELQFALAIKEGKLHLDEGDLPHIDDIVSVCLGLVTIDDQSSIIRLVHYTTQEYFVQTQKDWVFNAHAEIARACITCLSFDIFEAGNCLTHDEWRARFQTTALYGYAAENWGCHVGYLPIDNRSIIDFLMNTSKVSACGQAEEYIKMPYFWDLEKRITGLHLLARLGLVELTSRILALKVDINFQDNFGQTPLSHAAENGHDKVVKLLLEKADVNLQNIHGQSPLSFAAENGYDAVVKLLLEQKANINMNGRFGQNPLLLAAENGHDAVVKLLLEQKANINMKERFGQTPLSFAAKNGHDAVVKLLLEQKADADSRDILGQNPLLLAAENGHGAVVKLLLEQKADSDSRDIFGKIPLSFAAENGHDAVVKLLLGQKADVAIQDSGRP
ncbi:hypothetical protein N7481_003514 [Penicillium waksmanii]|uniref:uncharacterized protein n=1 Tax=Penicillium waksmanii TaxID=69791 RepID=UPI0025468737|nr:uncharacterized protein N7481_003514 [Penicillium waksmanii]KAJ5988304.1 hypothetical protein N7481_003514 [Penicillium waksmanii]